MNIAKWDFPSFEQWNKRRVYNGSIGDYNCSIRVFSWNGDEATYVCAISTSSNPLNMYVDKIVESDVNIKYDDNDSLQKWYNRVTKYTQTKWEEYIMNTYFHDA